MAEQNPTAKLLDIDAIRAAILNERGIAIDRDDPVIITALVSDHMLTRMQQILNEQANSLQESFRAAFDASEADARVRAGRAITEAADYVDERLRLTAVEALDTAGQELRQAVLQMQDLYGQLQQEAKRIRRLKTGSIALFTVSLIGAVICLVAAASVILNGSTG